MERSGSGWSHNWFRLSQNSACFVCYRSAMEENTKCVKLAVLMECQRDVIERHIDEHKWFKHIPDKDRGIMDFIRQYAWLMREMYCGYACEERNKCEIARKIREKKTGP